MKEYVGDCRLCSREVYCLDGFLNGSIEDGELICFECSADETSPPLQNDKD